MAELVTLRGERLTESNGDVVELARDVLRRAEAGEITGLAIAAVQSDGDLCTNWETPEGAFFPLAAAIMCLNARYADGMRSE